MLGAATLMIPFLFIRSAEPVLVSGPYITWFAGHLAAHSMGTGDSVFVNVEYRNPGVHATGQAFYVRVNGTTTAWIPEQVFTADDDYLSGALFSAASLGWVGAGSYELWSTFRRQSTGLFDLTSNIITLTVA